MIEPDEIEIDEEINPERLEVIQNAYNIFLEVCRWAPQITPPR